VENIVDKAHYVDAIKNLKYLISLESDVRAF